MILIVDDNAQMRDLIKSLVANDSHDMLECADGNEAVDLYRRFRPDLVLMDIKMGQMDGLAATRLITTSFPDARVVIVSNYNDPQLQGEAKEAGACAYVLKENLTDLQKILAAPIAVQTKHGTT